MINIKHSKHLLAAVIAAIIPALLVLDVLPDKVETFFSFLLFPGAIVAMVIGGGVHNAGHVAIFLGLWLWCYALTLLAFFLASKLGSRQNASNK